MKLKDKKISKELKEYIRKYTTIAERVAICKKNNISYNYLELSIFTFKVCISERTEPAIMELTKLAIENREKEVDFSLVFTKKLREWI